jgi:hypothetical protein
VARPAVDVIAKNHISSIHDMAHFLPPVGSGEPQYVIKGCADRGARVVRESQLASAVHFPQPVADQFNSQITPAQGQAFDPCESRSAEVVRGYAVR